ncbi:universal stress protein, partial [Candidatus Bathyarchaeota archaeon]|nr:universal stress protein [Candidatus Bathyarchaeota archaeon]NIR17440.1 universal stress protein [Desulfobacterales bacterium]NIU81580.1 universal stress protein [Candidatus Bathyarchaeota archaeon]NIV68222.1 universal stress protein [Candidatus Bathyarchaeota archaeon]NIW16478.1 universal stress protein [Candidatus Bathyarchaeota archaeon]
KTGLSKILVAIDGSEGAEMALDYAAELARSHEANLTLLNVQESKLFGFKPEVVREVGERILSEAVEKVRELKPYTRLEFGDPSETIIKVAEDQEYDLTIMGSRGLSGVKRFFLGSVSDDVSHHTANSVLIVR